MWVNFKTYIIFILTHNSTFYYFIGLKGQKHKSNYKSLLMDT